MSEEEMKFFYKSNKKYSYIRIFNIFLVLRNVFRSF